MDVSIASPTDDLPARVARRPTIGGDEVRKLLETPREALWARADAIRSERVGDAVHLRGIVEFSNICANDCLYCGIRRTNRGPKRYRMSADEILALAHRMKGWGHGTIVLQSGEVDRPRENDRIARLVERIRHDTELSVTLSCGNRSPEIYRRWRDAGMDRYLLRFETSDPALFAELHPDCTLDERLDCLAALADLRVQVGSGFMIGLPGSSLDTLIEDIRLVHALDLDMVGVGPFIAHPATPLAGRANLWADDPEMVFQVIATLRLVDPDLRLPATTALDAFFPGTGRDLALQRGADVFMPNDTPGRYRHDYQLYPNKPCVDEGDGSCAGCVTARIWSLGRMIGEGPGHSPKSLRRSPVA
ncbi:MAG: [FeFe] hydrogenase H-cluster radical SAM maturase HydE [Hyphomicrobiales bacterium]|nr:[FeFe] hydrogenase H-cluster radical SAM maturase HydE [Hyphomicrobiales bacterium]